MSIPDERRSHTGATPSARSTADATSPSWSRYNDSPYWIGERIGAGGMGTVHLGLKQGALGFRRLLAIKRLHPHLTTDPDFVARFKDEIRLVSRLNHPNVVQTFDVLESLGELALIMEYVDGVTLHQLQRDASAAKTPLPVPVAVGIVAQALHGLHAAHELIDDDGYALQLVHRDFSPQNILISREGLVKVLDFGVAKAANDVHVTRSGQLSGKAPYMAPEQVQGANVDRRTDVFAAGVVLWEALTSVRLFRPAGATEDVALRNVLAMRVQPPSHLRSELGSALDRIVLRALDRDPARRFGSARDFALALEEIVKDASPSAVASSVVTLSTDRLLSRAVSSAAPPSSAQGREPMPEARRRDGTTGSARLGNSTPTTPSAVRFVTATSPTRANGDTEVRSPEHELQTCDVQGVSLDDFRPRRGPKRWAIAFATLALLGVVAWQTVTASSGPEPVSEVQPQGGAASSGVALPDSPPEVRGDWLADAKPAPRSSEAAARPTAPRASAAASAVETTKRAHSVGTPRARKATAGGGSRSKPSTESGAAASRPGCSPPTYVDAEGIRHFKPECL